MSGGALSDAAGTGPSPWIVGATFGAAHALTETATLGAFGLGLGWRDALVITLTCASAALVGAIGIAIVAHFSLHSLPNRRAALTAGLAFVELALAADLGAANTMTGEFLLLLAACATLLAIFSEASSRVSPWTRAALHVAITGPAAAATLANDAARLALVTPDTAPRLRWTLIASSMGLGGLALLLLLRRPGPRGAQGLAPLFTLLILPTLLFSTALPRPLDMHVRLRPAAEADAGSRPDVILVVLDTVRSDHLDLFEYPRETMPQLTRFAREQCAVSMSSLATAPSSLPSHASMFTGRFSTRHGGHKPFLAHLEMAEGPGQPGPPSYAYSIRQDAPVLAEQLASAGYQTAGFAANFGVLNAFGLDRGFEHYDVAPGPPYLGQRMAWIARWRLFGRKPGGLVDRLLPESFARRTVLFTERVPDYRRAEEINAQAMRWLDDRDDRPAFLFLNYFDAHDPYLPVPELDGSFMDEPDNLSWVGFPKQDYSDLLNGQREPSAQEIAWMEAQYDAEMLYLDGELARMFEALKDAGRWEQSLVVVTSDHGEGFWDHRFLRHSTTLYQSQTGVPLLIKLPGSTKLKAPAPDHLQSIDLMPTLLQHLELPIPEDLDGSPWGRGREAALAEVFCHHPEEPRLYREMTAVVRDGIKYIQVWEIDTDSYVEEAYDLVADPKETRDLMQSESPPDVQRHREAAKALVDQRPKALEYWLVEGGSETDEALLESLRAMGYLGDDEDD